MEARIYLKQLKEDGWYLGATEGPSRQYVHRKRSGLLTVCVRHNDVLGPETARAAATPAESDADGEPRIAVEETATGASAYSPDLPGVVASGPDDATTRARLARALAFHRAALAP